MEPKWHLANKRRNLQPTMSRRLLLRSFLAILLLFLVTIAWYLYHEVGRTFIDDPTVWESEIAAFEDADRVSPPARDAVLFIGSSSIRHWDEFELDMAPLRVIRRGFGGAKLTDLIYFADRIIFPYARYAPRAIVIHAGGNELNNVPGNSWRTPEEALSDYRSLMGLIRSRLPETPIYFLALRPSKLPGARDEYLELIRADCDADASLHYLDAGAGLTLADGSPDPSLIRWDYIHLNREGYEVWAPPVRERLLRDLGQGPDAS